MIHRTPEIQQSSWRAELASVVTDPAQLLDILDLPRALLPAALKAHALFPLRVPKSYLSRIKRGDAHDPLLRQILPLGAEAAFSPGFSEDPVGDLAAHVALGVLHKYEGRVLLTATGACAVHCRYCFRRHFPYAEANAARDQWREALAYVASDPTIGEVILSGGDPLTLSDDKLMRFVTELRAIPHVRRLRLHTRVPVVIPSRVDDALLGWLRGAGVSVAMVLHINHAQEVDWGVQEACGRLRGAGVTLLNQAVLLGGVNDHPDTLAALSERLFDVGVLPYYLHMLDRVQGAAHFAVDEARATELMGALRDRLPGYLVPRLVREVAGAPAKIPVVAFGAAAHCG